MIIFWIYNINGLWKDEWRNKHTMDWLVIFYLDKQKAMDLCGVISVITRQQQIKKSECRIKCQFWGWRFLQTASMERSCLSLCYRWVMFQEFVSVCTAAWSKPVAAQDKELLEWKCHGLATSHSTPLLVFSVCQDYWMNKLGHRHITCCSCRYEIHSQESMESCICLL